MLYIIYFITELKCLEIDLKYFIESSDEPRRRMILDNNLVKMVQDSDVLQLKKSKPGIRDIFNFDISNNNLSSDTYNIKSGDQYLKRKNINHSTITSGRLLNNENLGLWSIKEVNDTFYEIRQDGLCMTEGEYDSKIIGYTVTLEKCRKFSKQMFRFRILENIKTGDGDILVELDDEKNVLKKHGKTTGFDVIEKTKPSDTEISEMTAYER